MLWLVFVALLGLAIGVSLGTKFANNCWLDTARRGIGNFCRGQMWFAIEEGEYCELKSIRGEK